MSDPSDPTLPADAAEPTGPDEYAPYVHDADVVADAARLLDDAMSSTLEDPWGAQRVLLDLVSAAGHPADSTLVRELSFVAAYELRVHMAGEPAGCDLQPASAGWPPEIRTVTADVMSLWRELSILVSSPSARGRTSDLLFVGKDGNGRTHATRAVGAYLEATDGVVGDLWVAEMLARAWQLARQIGDWTLEDRVRQRCAELATADLDAGRQQPGVTVPLLAAIAQDRRPGATSPDPVDVDALLRRAIEHFPRSDIASALAGMLRSRTTDDTALVQIARAEAAVYQAEVDGSSGLVRQIHLEALIDLARRRGLRDIEDDAVVALQSIDGADLGLQVISEAIDIPRVAIEEILGPYTASPDWHDALSYFLQTDPPTGDIDSLDAQAHQLRSQFPLQELFPAVILGPDHLPRLHVQTEEQRQAHQMAQSATIRADIGGRILAEGLDRIAARHRLPTQQELVAYLSLDGRLDASLAAVLARGLHHFWSGDYEAVIYVVVPRIEAAARAVLRTLDEAIYRTEVGNDPGQYAGLYTLLEHLARLGLDPSWLYFLRWLLLGPLGANLRNDVAHGFDVPLTPSLAALVLRAAALLFGIAAAAEPPSPAADPPHQTRTVTERLIGLLRSPVDSPTRLLWVGSPGPLAQAGAKVGTWLDGLVDRARQFIRSEDERS